MAKRGVTTYLETLDGDCATFFDLVPDLLVVIDRNGNIARVNRSFERVLGRTRADMFGQGMARIVLVDDLVKFIRAFTSPYPEPFRLLYKDHGEVRCRLIDWKVRRGRSYIVMRSMDE